MNKTSLLYWLPRICELGIPYPHTVCLPAGEDILAPLDGAEIPAKLMDSIRSAARSIGYPLFLRTDLQSGKHGWKNTCYIPEESLLGKNLAGVVEENMLGACCFGPMFEALVFRKFLDLDATFIAFYGDMPVNRERRYFIKGGEVVCHHPYWPEHAIDGHTKDVDWKDKLAALNDEPAEEIALLSGYAKRVSKELPEYWSVDFAKAKDGTWYLIDMALGAESFHWENCTEDTK
jgi:hypothetical protein